MWILSYMPEWVTHFIFTLGLIGVLVGFLLGFIPLIKTYSLPIKIISIIVLCFGIYLEGGLADYKEWELKVKEVEAKVAKAEAESAHLNTQLQAALTDRGKVIKEKGDTIVKYIDRYNDREVLKEVLKEVPGPERVRIEEVVKFVENCPIPKELIDIHNQAVKMNQGEKK